jgi:Ser/Thr protein kinase RdoA (MazF antagonist)
MNWANAEGLTFVPRVYDYLNPDADVLGRTSIAFDAGFLWDLTCWMPGRADFPERPSQARMEAACTALARLHLVWAHDPDSIRERFRVLYLPAQDGCPAVHRRLAVVRRWNALVERGWRPDFDYHPGWLWAHRAWYNINAQIDRVTAQLLPWLEVPVNVQPCLCDVWHEHVLFEGDQVTGLIDYDGMKVDNVAVDLARLLGSLAGDGAELRDAGFRAYTAVRPLSLAEAGLVTALDHTGTLLGAVTWLLWLYRDCRTFVDWEAAARRLAELVRRLEGWG